MPKRRIETGIPMPSVYSARMARGERNYPFSELEIGQSFFVKPVMKGIPASCARRGKELGKKFTTRRMNGGIRVWRTA